MLETSIQTRVGHYIQTILPTPRKMSGLFEVKVVDGSSFHISKVLEHQQKSLKSHDKAGTYWKISDSDPRKKPADFMVATGTAWLVIYFSESKYTYFCQAKKLLKNKKSYSEKEIEALSFRKALI